MNASYSLTIVEIENYLQRIFDLESKLLDKDFKIAMLEFELKLEKNLIQCFKKHLLHPTSAVKF